jgi:Zn-dependent protease
VRSFIDGLDWSRLTDILISVIPALICITFHEVSHGFVAYRLGDDTAKAAGRLTLNPIKHIDVFGLIMMAVFGFGWAKPVPVDMRRFKNPKRGMALTAFAGPASNILLAAVMFATAGAIAAFMPEEVVIGAIGGDGAVWTVVWTLIDRTAVLSTALAVFNIIPIPPLDGSKVLFSLFSDRAYEKLMRVERYGFIILIALVYTGALDSTIGVMRDFVLEKLVYVAEGAYWLASKIAG